MCSAAPTVAKRCIAHAVPVSKSGDPGMRRNQRGKIGYILLWLIGVPVPILFGIFLLRGCT